VIGGPALLDTEATSAYFDTFRPGPFGSEPYLVASVDVAVADTADHARRLLLPEAWALASSRQSGSFAPLQSVDEAQRQLDQAPETVRAAVARWYRTAITGTPGQAADEVERLLARTGAVELMATTSTYDRDDLADLDAALAALQGS
jgi:alkanesulfonate monooxygenase SsuD/methylene tetrahydromethanopterin reductase-like flavin-dependent oxidoreductase (luciferase family)